MGRPEMVQRCLENLRATTADHDVQIIVAAADTDSAALKDANLVLWEQEPQGCSAAWNRCLKWANGDPIVFAADDLEWGEGWLDAALAKLAEFDEGWGLVGFNDGHWGSELSTHYLMSRRFIVEVLGGVVAWDFYRHSFNDAEVNDRARAAGRYAWAEDARVYHRHWIFGDREQDDTDRKTLGDHAASERIYKERKAAGFPNEGIEPILRR